MIKNIILAILGISGFVWLFSSNTPWQDLAEMYRTETKAPDVFTIAENQRISFKRIQENKSGILALTNLGLGVSEAGLYLADSSFPLLSAQFFPPLLIPWSDIIYRRNLGTGSYSFDLGVPPITRFSIKSETLDRLEENYGESIFKRKLGEPK